MTNKIKTLCLILGLTTCLIVMLIAKVEFSQKETEASKEIKNSPPTTQVVVNTGVQWIIQTTCKILKSTQYLL